MDAEWTWQDREYFEKNPTRGWYVRTAFPEEVKLSILRAELETRRGWEGAIRVLEQSSYSAELQIAVIQIEPGLRTRLPVITPLGEAAQSTPHIIFTDGGPVAGLDHMDKVAADLRAQRDALKEEGVRGRIDHRGDECAKCHKPFTVPCLTFIYPHPAGGSAYLCKSCGEKRIRRGQVISNPSVYLSDDLNTDDPDVRRQIDELGELGRRMLRGSSRH